MVKSLDLPRAVWIMGPSGEITDNTITALVTLRQQFGGHALKKA